MSENSVFESNTTQSKVSDSSIGRRIGLIATGLVGGSLVALYAVAGPFVAPALRKVCLPFVPATSAQVDNVFRVLRSRSGGSLVDIGSGDGRIVSKVTESLARLLCSSWQNHVLLFPDQRRLCSEP